MIDEEISSIIKECHDETMQILKDNRDKLDLLTETLIAKETLDDLEIRTLLGIGYKNKNIVIEQGAKNTGETNNNVSKSSDNNDVEKDEKNKKEGNT